MSLREIHLKKLIAVMFADRSRQISMLRSDIRDERRKFRGESKGGGDFHTPFWSDAKDHVNGISELRETTVARIAANDRRKRLYPELEWGFLDWWNNKRRWTNENPTSELLSVKGVVDFPALECTVKIENLLALAIGRSRNRIIYPYFAEEPRLTSDAARLALWALSEAIRDYPSEEFRILDIIRASSFAIEDVGLRGDEAVEFEDRYREIVQLWEKLWEEYEPV